MNSDGRRCDVRENDWPYNLFDALAIKSDDPIDHLGDIGTLELAMCMSRLTDREKKVIRVRYFEQKTLKEAGEVFGVTGNRVREVEAKALRKLRHPAGAACVILRDGAKAYIEKRANELADEILKLRIDAMEQAYRDKLNEIAKEDMEKIRERQKAIRIEDLHMSVRATNCLKRAFCDTVDDVVTSFPKYSDAVRIRNLGRKSLEEIITTFAGIGIEWPIMDVDGGT